MPNETRRLDIYKNFVIVGGMDNKTAKEILHKLMVKIVDNGSALIELGTSETAAIRQLIYPTKK